jgi:hypothetical protein
MKKLSTIIMALALVLGMSQCKKQETPATGNTTPTNPGVHITVNVGDQDGKDDKDNNGEKHNIAPQYGLFSFSSGDKLYVGHDGKFVGTLKFKNGFFDGTIYPDASVTDQPLHFFFLGNSELDGDTIVNQTTSLSISIADQSENLPVLSYGASTKPFTGPNTTYSTTLKNKCALVRFDLLNQGDYEVTLSNVPTLATVNFANPTAETAIVATEGQTNGNITLYGEEGNTAIRWAILLPGTNLSTGHGDLNITYSGNVNLAELAYNDYVNSGISINNPLPLPDAPDAEYAVKTSGDELTQFSVSANKKVYFSRGNLKADFTSGGYAEGWSFHDTQFGEVAGPTQNLDNPNDKYYYLHFQSGTNTNNPAAPNGIIFINHQDYGDRFTWGYFSSITLATTEYVHSEEDLSKTAAVAKDWGCVFTENSPEGGNWRTLSANEWIYLFNGPSTVRGDKRFLRVRIKNFNVNPIDDRYNEEYWGVFVFPDQYQASNLTGTYTFNSDTSTEIDYSNADVAQMLNDGAVFLPCVGYRYDDRYYDYVCYSLGYKIGAGIGYYWSSTHIDGTTNYAKALKFVVRGYAPNSTTGISIEDLPRNYGYCVRLVWDAN